MSHQYVVIKRGGEIAHYDVTKMRKVINWASEGLEVNSIELESNFEMSLKDNITTREIQQSLIFSALKLTSIDELDWKYVSG